MKPFLVLSASLLLALGAAGCGSDSSPADSPDADSRAADANPAKNAGAPDDDGADAGPERVFLSTSVTEGGKPRPLAPKSRIRLALGDGELGANAGCNHLSGHAEFDGDTLVVAEFGGTEMACGKKLMDQEEWLKGVLTGKPTWRLDGDTLVLTRGETRIVLKETKG